MPASNTNSYLHDARNNYDAVRPAPIYADANQLIGQCQPTIHISTNCYYGYHDPNSSENAIVGTDCEMLELPFANETASPHSTARKRSADVIEYSQSKRPRQDASSICSLVGTRSSPSHSASAFNVNIPTSYTLCLKYRFVFSISLLPT